MTSVYGRTGAKGIIDATVSNGADWIESFKIDVAGAQISGADTSVWQLNVRDDSGTVVLTATTADSTLTVTQNTTYTLFDISVAQADIDDLEGDYTLDLAEQTAASKIVHWLHGTISFYDEPVWSS